jgi:nucleoside-diphosphate-sugar epimerase
MGEIVRDAGSVPGIIERIQQAARTGQASLDAVTRSRLRLLTAELIAVKPGAVSEHARFLAVHERGLIMPEDDLRSRLMGATILVTGGTGCIGSALMAQLAMRGPRHLVSVSRHGAPRREHPAGAEFLRADIRDRDALEALVRRVRPDIVFHVAAQRDPGLAETEVHAAITTNLLGTRNVIAAARAAGVSQVVYASTGKALRPYSPEVYTASKRAAEWLLAEAAAGDDLLCSAARFTHVVDNSIIYQRLLTWASPPAARPGEVIRLHSPDIAFYVQSARESAQLLLVACLGAAPGQLRVHAISDLGLPVTLLDLALGVLAATGSPTPLYFSGYDAGYEEAPFPGLYDPLTAGDVSPLLNAFEAAWAASSPSPEVDAARLQFAADQPLPKHLKALAEDCERTRSPARLRERLNDLSWSLLDATLRAVPAEALRRCAIRTRRHWGSMPPGQRRMLEAVEDLIEA